MSNSEKSFQELLLELTQNIEITKTPVTFHQRGILYDCDRTFLSDYRVIVETIKSIIGSFKFNTESFEHLKIFTSVSSTGWCCFTVDSINSNLVYTIFSTLPIKVEFETSLDNILKPKKTTIKRLEF